MTPSRPGSASWVGSRHDRVAARPRQDKRVPCPAPALLYSGRLHRLKECGRCSWLFLDQSKAQRRRWCRTEVCGNRARVERHYHRNH
ncbi:CGNR zinc finger domain-containing protein [Litchfieldella qijiaojingensis]|uniref:CGNR zinc finger domain-containing protein n=1 Tax=Litchfieldella qijiaojingensis TaxID=980347 RepID=UPI00167BA176